MIDSFNFRASVTLLEMFLPFLNKLISLVETSFSYRLNREQLRIKSREIAKSSFESIKLKKKLLF